MTKRLTAVICGVVFAMMSQSVQAKDNLDNGIVWQDLFQDPAWQTEFMEQKIHEYFPDERVAQIMIAIASCESTGPGSDQIVQWEPDGKLLHNRDGGQARGAFQVMMFTHADEMKRLGLHIGNIDDYMTFVKILYQQGRFAPWESSRDCWQQERVAQN